MQTQLTTAAREWARDLTEWRRYLHANPEISFQEYETTEWLARKMEEWNIAYTRPTPTGLVGVIEGRRPGKTIALRADIDALPIMEANEFEFKSTRPGAMHACGHDGHTAILLGLSRFFSQNRDFAGRIKLLFQPAEELAPGGAKAFVEAGVLDDVDACIGLHLISDLPTGIATICNGPMMANSDSFTAVLTGRGGHGASPHQTIDAVMVACNAVMNLQTVVARKVDPTKPAVLTVGSIHAGTTFNIIADTAEIKGTVRTFHADVRQQVHDEIKRTLESTCAMYGATVELKYTWGYPAVLNNPEVADVLRAAAGEALGAENVRPQTPIMGGEDFAYYTQKVPGAFMFVGCRNAEAGAVWEHHHPRFTIDEGALSLGMEIMGRAAVKLLG
ncbi:MAG: M20 metallopeptidase family protein [Bacillota bacterium]